MRIALFWNNIDPQEYELAVQFLAFKNEAFLRQFGEIKPCHLAFSRVQETFDAMFHFLKEHDMQFGILSYRPAWALDPLKLKMLLDTQKVRQAAVSVRVGKIQARAAAF